MALLTDGDPNDTLALKVYETAILDVAHSEGIDLDVKLSLSTDEVSEDVLDILLDHTRAQDPISNVRRVIGVSDVVVTPQLKRWQALHTLEIVYRDAFNNQLNDRYRVKFEEYRELARNAREHTVRFGIGLVMSPIPKAQEPTLSAVSGSAAGGTFYVRVSWVNTLGQPAGQEGAPSDASALSTSDQQNLVVQAVNPPAGATGFKVYVGPSSDALQLQNASPIAVGGAFTMPNSGLVEGAAPGTGQASEVFIIGGSALRRG